MTTWFLSAALVLFALGLIIVLLALRELRRQSVDIEGRMEGLESKLDQRWTELQRLLSTREGLQPRAAAGASAERLDALSERLEGRLASLSGEAQARGVEEDRVRARLEVAADGLRDRVDELFRHSESLDTRLVRLGSRLEEMAESQAGASLSAAAHQPAAPNPHELARRHLRRAGYHEIELGRPDEGEGGVLRFSVRAQKNGTPHQGFVEVDEGSVIRESVGVPTRMFP